MSDKGNKNAAKKRALELAQRLAEPPAKKAEVAAEPSPRIQDVTEDAVIREVKEKYHKVVDSTDEEMTTLFGDEETAHALKNPIDPRVQGDLLSALLEAKVQETVHKGHKQYVDVEDNTEAQLGREKIHAELLKKVEMDNECVGRVYMSNKGFVFASDDLTKTIPLDKWRNPYFLFVCTGVDGVLTFEPTKRGGMTKKVVECLTGIVYFNGAFQHAYFSDDSPIDVVDSLTEMMDTSKGAFPTVKAYLLRSVGLPYIPDMSVMQSIAAAEDLPAGFSNEKHVDMVVNSDLDIITAKLEADERAQAIVKKMLLYNREHLRHTLDDEAIMASAKAIDEMRNKYIESLLANTDPFNLVARCGFLPPSDD